MTQKRKVAKRQAVPELGRVPMVPKGIATASLAEQADALWESFAASTGATFLEKQGLEGIIQSNLAICVQSNFDGIVPWTAIIY